MSILSKSTNRKIFKNKEQEPKPSKSLKKALKEVDYMEKHPEKYKTYHNVDELFEDLSKDK